MLPAAQAIVTDALRQGPGGQLPTNIQYSERYGFSAGTIQRAISTLTERGALELRSRGHLGRFIVAVDTGGAWQVAGLPAIRLLLPPSGPVEVDVLQDILARELADARIPYAIGHLRGGARRLLAVDEHRCDLALVSEGVRSASRQAGPFRSLGSGTYYAPGRLVVVRATVRLTHSVRVAAVDPDSEDHVALTRAAFGTEDIEMKPTRFTEVPAAVLRGDVDAGVWHRAHSVVPLHLAGLTLEPLPSPALHRAAGLSAASFVASTHRPEMLAVLRNLRLTALRDEQTRAIVEEARRENT